MVDEFRHDENEDYVEQKCLYEYYPFTHCVLRREYDFNTKPRLLWTAGVVGTFGILLFVGSFFLRF